MVTAAANAALDVIRDEPELRERLWDNCRFTHGELSRLGFRLNDAPKRPDGGLPQGVRPDDVVVHQQDVQAVVNALWAGGAEAMTIMGVRVSSTSAVRCGGNTLLLGGRVYSPPFEVTAIGDPDRMRAALDASDGVTALREAAAAFGLSYQETTRAEVTLPAYDGSTDLQYAHVVG